jgi:hypothetical protein
MTGFRAAGSEKEFVIPGRAQREPGIHTPCGRVLR